MTAAGETRPASVPPLVRGLALPCWRARALKLANLLEDALEGAAAGAECDGRWRSTGRLAGAADAADAVVEKMEAEQAAGVGERVAP